MRGLGEFFSDWSRRFPKPSAAAHHDFHIDNETTSFFLTGQNLAATPGKGLPAWREAAFIFMNRNAEKASETLRMPRRGTIEILWQVKI